MAESFNEDVNAKMPGSYGNKIRKWKIAGAKEGISSFVTSTNRAPHFHLVENGHAKYDFHGRYTGGFVPGQALCRADAAGVPGEISGAYDPEKISNMVAETQSVKGGRDKWLKKT